MIVAGTREKTTKKIMQRFAELFHSIPDAIVQSKTDLYIKLANGTEIEGFPSNSDAIRGDTKIAAIFIDEAAHFKLIDDSVVMNAIKPIVDTNKSDLYMISTPNGMRGFFYEIDKEANDYMKLKYNIHQAIGFIYTKITRPVNINYSLGCLLNFPKITGSNNGHIRKSPHYT